MKGIITADVVGSTRIPQEQRGILPEVLHKLLLQLQSISPLRLEIYRGDSFQVEVERYAYTPLIAALLRIGMVSMSLNKAYRLDARMSIGIGEVSYAGESLGQSDGEAFVLSGRMFDSLGKRRLKITTPRATANEELSVLSIILDDLISCLTIAQSKVVFECLYNPEIKQKSIAEKLKVKPQVISKTLKASKASIIEVVLKRMEYVLTNYLRK